MPPIPRQIQLTGFGRCVGNLQDLSHRPRDVPRQLQPYPRSRTQRAFTGRKELAIRRSSLGCANTVQLQRAEAGVACEGYWETWRSQHGAVKSLRKQGGNVTEMLGLQICSLAPQDLTKPQTLATRCSNRVEGMVFDCNNSGIQ